VLARAEHQRPDPVAASKGTSLAHVTGEDLARIGAFLNGLPTVNIMSKNDDSIEITLRSDAGLPYLSIEMDERNQGSIMISDVNGLPQIIVGANELTQRLQKETNGIFVFNKGQLILTLPKE
jgi:hypothetical protein